MKNFFHYILTFLITILLFGEVISRIIDINHKPIYFNNNGYIDFVSNQKGMYINGIFPIVQKFEYRINDVGYNNLLDYSQINYDKYNIAFLGDSFIGAIRSDISDEISSILNKKNKGIQSYQFGGSGYKFYDMLENYKRFNLKKFDMVVFCLSKTNLHLETGKSTYSAKKEKLKNILFKSKFISYLSNNHGIVNKINKIFKKTSHPNEVLLSSNDIKKIKMFFKSNKNTFIILKDSTEYYYFKENISDKVIKINHEEKPIDFGKYDRHWNKKGKLNVANTIFDFVKLNN